MSSENTAGSRLRGLLGFNLLTGVVLGVVGFYVGWWLGHQIHYTGIQYFADTGQNDVALALGYLTIVSIHGAMMMGIMTSGVLGPFANYFVPLQIGARRMAYPRLESLSFWLLMAAGTILVSTVFFGGFPTGWTGYAPLNDE